MIKILPPDVISKIAAGEVVDRPASVIKELLENALDAGATAIEIHLKDAGKEQIHVKDNGFGMSKPDLETIFQRHATSKINSIEDLEGLFSMGFRGEALYSIAAVSDIVLHSQKLASENKDRLEAWQIHLRAGARIDLAPCAPFGHGTDIKVSELFFNMPARRKFLKSNTAELNQIINIVLPYALIYPEKRFVLTNAGRALLDLQGALNRIDRTADALNVDPKDLIETDQEYPQERMRIRLVLGNINIQRARRDLQFIFINDRPVESKNLGFNVNDVYKLILPPGVWGAFVLDIHLDPANVDVNVHPTKREVRLKDEAKIVSLVRRLVEHQLMTYGQAREIKAATAWPAHTQTGLPADKIIFGPGQWQGMFDPAAFSRPGTLAPALLAPDLNLFAPNRPLQDKFAQARYIGQFMNKYLLFENQSTLMIVDQHAAQERIMYEQFKNQIDAGKIEVQHLLTPLLLKLTPTEQIHWEEMQEDFKTLGLETTLFDAETLAIQTQPVLLKNVERAVRTLLGGESASHCDKDTLARRACKASITAGDQLLPPQVEHQRKQLLACKDPFTCPHGRPTVIEINDQFLEKHFLR